MLKFMGEFNNCVDIKGRVVIPNKFREQLGESFIVTKSFDGCLAVYDFKQWEFLQDRLGPMPMVSTAARTIRRIIVGSAFETGTDKQGRILIPAALREYSSIEKEAVIIGNIDHIEIWGKEVWKKKMEEINVDETAQKLYDAGIYI